MSIRKSKTRKSQALALSSSEELVPSVNVQAMVNAFLSQHIENIKKLSPLSGYQAAGHQYIAQCSCGWMHLAASRSAAQGFYMTHLIQEAREEGPVNQIMELTRNWILKGRIG